MLSYFSSFYWSDIIARYFIVAEKDMVQALFPIVLDKNRAPHLELFLLFLHGSSHQRITLDQWDSFLQFNYLVKLDLSNHEDDGACQLLLSFRRRIIF